MAPPRPGEGPATGRGRSSGHRHGRHPGPGCCHARRRPAGPASRERRRFRRRVHRQDVLALPALTGLFPGHGYPRMAGRARRRDPRCRFGGGHPATQPPSVPVRRVVLVRGDAGTGEWARAVRPSIDGGSFHLCAAGRPLRDRGLGNSGPARTLRTPPGRPGRRWSGGGVGLRGRRPGPGGPLEGQRHVLDTRHGAHARRGQLQRAPVPRQGLERSGTGRPRQSGTSPRPSASSPRPRTLTTDSDWR